MAPAMPGSREGGTASSPSPLCTMEMLRAGIERKAGGQAPAGKRLELGLPRETFPRHGSGVAKPWGEGQEVA